MKLVVVCQYSYGVPLDWCAEDQQVHEKYFSYVFKAILPSSQPSLTTSLVCKTKAALFNNNLVLHDFLFF